MPAPDFETLLYSTAGAVATVTLNRPESLNTIVPPMPDEIEAAIGLAERDPDIKVIQSVDIHGEAAVAYQTAKDLLASKQQVNAFVCLEAVACPEVGEAVKESNATGKVTIIAMDTDQRTLNWIQEGLVAATIAQKPYTMAYVGVKLLDDMHHQKYASLDTNFKQDSSSPYPAAVYTGTFLVGKENLQTFMSQTQPKANASPKP